ncbi:MAG: GntR family transcriptional regulator [Chloroflexi bacterium]|nr:GntR family transcriptional regulator [Chloroflexota bacterium]
MSTLHRDGPVPLYYQLKQLLKEQLANSDDYPPDSRIPGEEELAATHRVSRMTARQALTELVNEGVLYRRAGKGTFVARPKIERKLARLTGYYEEMSGRGLQPGTRVLGESLVEAGRKVAAFLEISPEEKVLQIFRLRLADGEPMAIQTVHVPHDRCPNLINDDLTLFSLYRLLEQKYGLKLGHAQEKITATTASRQQASLLAIPKDAPLLQIERLTFLDSGFPIEYVESFYRADRYAYTTSLFR